MRLYLELADQALPTDGLLRTAHPSNAEDLETARVSVRDRVQRAHRIWRHLSDEQRTSLWRDVRAARFRYLRRKILGVLSASLDTNLDVRRFPALGIGEERPFDASITIVVPAYNYAHFLPGCLDSLLNSSRQDFPIIVVNPGSTDDTEEVLAGYADNPRITVVNRSERHLIGCNRNLGIRLASTRYVAIVDADDEVWPEYVEVATFVAELFGFDVVGSQLDNFGQVTGVWAGQPRFPSLSLLLDGNALISHSVMRRDSIAAAGGFIDSGVGAELLYEDWQAWQRLAAMGGRMYNISQPLVRYRIHAASQSSDVTVNAAALHAPAISESNRDVLQRAPRLAWRRNASVLEPVVTEESPGVDPVDGPILVAVLPFLDVGGMLNTAATVAKEAVARGWRVYICSTEGSAEDINSVRTWFPRSNCYLVALDQVMPVPAYEPWFAYLSTRARQTILWDMSTPWIYEGGLASVRQHFTGVVTTVVNPVHAEKQRTVSEYVDTFVLESPHLRPLVGAEVAEKSVVIQNGVDLQRFSGQPRRRAEGRLQVYWVGRLSIEKDPWLFLRIAEASHSDQFDFVMVGDGPLRSDICRACEKTNKVRLLDATTDVVPLLRSADALVITSVMEGRPNVILEAQAAKVVVISSDVGGVRQMVRDGVDGVVCAERTVHEYLAALDLVSDEFTRDAMNDNAYDRVTRDSDASRMTADYLDLFESLLAE